MVIIAGFGFYVISQIFFQMGFFGGYEGMNRAIIGLLQAALIIPLIYFGLKHLKIDKEKIGISKKTSGEIHSLEPV